MTKEYCVMRIGDGERIEVSPLLDSRQSCINEINKLMGCDSGVGRYCEYEIYEREVTNWKRSEQQPTRTSGIHGLEVK